MFTGGQQMGQVASGSGGAQNAFVGMAMGEAAKLFEQQSGQGNTVCQASLHILATLTDSLAIWCDERRCGATCR
jgi:hypothetical protein